jgi:hypothetical protein
MGLIVAPLSDKRKPPSLSSEADLSNSRVMGIGLRADERLQRGCEPRPTRNQVIAKIAQLQAQLVVEGGETGELDAQVAPWFDAAIEAWAGPDSGGSSEAYAETLGISRQHVDAMRAGKKSVPLRALLPLLQSREAVARFCSSLCAAVGLEPPQPKRALTLGQLVESMLTLFASNPALLALIQAEAAQRWGAEPEEVLRLVRSQADV